MEVAHGQGFTLSGSVKVICIEVSYVGRGLRGVVVFQERVVGFRIAI